MASKIIGKPQKALSLLYKERVRKKALSITADSSHPLSREFVLLNSGRRYRVPLATKNIYKKSFVPRAVNILNSTEWPTVWQYWWWWWWWWWNEDDDDDDYETGFLMLVYPFSVLLSCLSMVWSSLLYCTLNVLSVCSLVSQRRISISVDNKDLLLLLLLLTFVKIADLQAHNASQNFCLFYYLTIWPIFLA